MKIRLALSILPLVWLAACAEPASTQPEAASQMVAMSAVARAEMARVNDARFGVAPASAPALADQASAEVLPAQPPAETLPAQPPAEALPTQAAAAVAPSPGIAPAYTVRYNAALVRIQVLLDRAHFSPGVIDGFGGDNVVRAASAYQARHSLPVNGRADDALLQTLATADPTGALTAYVITGADVRGPFVDVPDDLQAMSRLDHVGFESPAEALAERFHMDVDLLRTLNPGADFARAGTEIVVANTGGDRNIAVAHIEVDKPGQAVRAYDSQGQLVAYYPATIGSESAPAPTGAYAVRAIAFDPTYHYNAARLPTFGQREHGPLTIQAGPNNPVGAVWIALTLDTYGIHGAPEASLVSKTQSHGCVRLTNWDAVELARASRPGVPVSFLESSAEAVSARRD